MPWFVSRFAGLAEVLWPGAEHLVRTVRAHGSLDVRSLGACAYLQPRCLLDSGRAGRVTGERGGGRGPKLGVGL